MPSPYLIETEDGSHSLFSDQFEVSYHSKYGAVQETAHVFIDAGLNFQSQHKSDIAILELGFGSGLNALMTLQACQSSQLNITYHTVESRPIDDALVAKLNYTTILNAHHLEPAFIKMHQLPSDQLHEFNPNFRFCKWVQKIEDLDLEERFDIIYFDAFAPGTQPELWTEAILRKMHDLLNPSGVLVTYCAKGVVKRTLKAVGFKVSGIPGPPGKREMTRATRSFR